MPAYAYSEPVQGLRRVVYLSTWRTAQGVSTQGACVIRKDASGSRYIKIYLDISSHSGERLQRVLAASQSRILMHLRHPPGYDAEYLFETA
jgi:hypothetical protein